MSQRISTNKLAGGINSTQTAIRVGGLVIGFGIALALGCGPAAADDSSSGTSSTSASSDSSTPSSSGSTTSAPDTTNAGGGGGGAGQGGAIFNHGQLSIADGLSAPPPSVDADTSPTAPGSSTDSGTAVKVGSTPTDNVGNGRQPGSSTFELRPGGEYGINWDITGSGGAIYNEGQLGLTPDTSP